MDIPPGSWSRSLLIATWVLLPVQLFLELYGERELTWVQLRVYLDLGFYGLETVDVQLHTMTVVPSAPTVMAHSVYCSL